MTVAVEQGRWERHTRQGYPEDLVIIGLGPCTGVTVVSADAGVAYGLHLTSPDVHEADTLDEMLRAAAAELGQAADLTVTMSGCCEAANPNAKHAREHVERQVKFHLPGAKEQIRWPSREVQSVDMTVDMDTGSCLIDERE